MGVLELFEDWRRTKRPAHSWGLAWFLAYEFCRRFYASHGIAPWVIDHEGLGYYGIQLDHVRCEMNKDVKEPYGRLTVNGDVENWRTGGPGCHELHTIRMCSTGVPTGEIVRSAIAHMAIEPIPAVSHLNCRHKRWGASYVLCFEVAAIIALRNEAEELCIWNHPYHTGRAIQESDPKSSMKEHPGAFLFIRDDKRLLLAGDGRLLDGSERNLWHGFMNGYGAVYLADLIEGSINAS